MAGARDLKRETIRIRREQALRNAEATREAEQRRTELLGQAPSRGRRSDVIFKTPRTHVVREGHRLVYVDPPSLDGVPFASPVAKALAKEAQLGPDAFEEWTPSSKSGFSKKDVEQIL